MNYRRATLAICLAVFGAAGCGTGGNGGSQNDADAYWTSYWNAQDEATREFICEIGPVDAAGLQWEQYMSFTIQELEAAISKTC